MISGLDKFTSLARPLIERAANTTVDVLQSGAQALPASVRDRLPASVAQAHQGQRLLVTHMDPKDQLSISVKRIASIAEERGHQVVTARADEISVQGRTVKAEGRSLGAFDGVVVRGGADHNPQALEGLRALEGAGYRLTNDAKTIALVADKGLVADKLLAKGLPHPPTVSIRPGTHDQVHERVVSTLKTLGDGPLVVKPISGKGGASVMFLDKTSTVGLRSIVDAVMSKTEGTGFAVQQWMKKGTGKDVRVYVYTTPENELVAAMAGMKRTAGKGQGAANVANGGVSARARTTPELREKAIEAARLTGVKFGAVDFIDGDAGKVIVELNTSPGVGKNLTQKIGFDHGKTIVDYALAPAR